MGQPGSELSRLIVFLLISTNAVCADTGVKYNLHCVNDYLFTFNCSLSIPSSENSSNSIASYWLSLIDTSEMRDECVCMLTYTDGHYFCSAKIYDPAPGDDDDDPETFMDLDEYQIFLCHDGSEPCEPLDGQYEPKMNIQPNAPCCLTVSHNSSQHNFTWKSTYEEYSHSMALPRSLKYELHYYKGGETNSVHSHTINAGSTDISVDGDHFVPDSEYSARVRSGPDQGSYSGEWSDWSPEVHWRTGPAVSEKVLAGAPSDIFLSALGKKVLISVLVAMLLLFFLGFIPIKKWRQRSFIPTPAPYFQSLYTDCQGDFKSWVVTQEIRADTLKVEETLHIDTLTEFEVEKEEKCEQPCHLQFLESSAYSNITDPGHDASLLGVPYAVSTLDPLSAQGSETLCSQPGSPTEGDSGCWLSSHTSLEKDPPWYCNDYCTLSAFQQAEHQRSLSTKSCPTETIRVEAVIL